MAWIFSDLTLAPLDSQILSMPLTMDCSAGSSGRWKEKDTGVERDCAARCSTSARVPTPGSAERRKIVTVAALLQRDLPQRSYHGSPETIDVATLARYANAFATGVLELAEQDSEFHYCKVK